MRIIIIHSILKILGLATLSSIIRKIMTSIINRDIVGGGAMMGHRII